MQAHRHRLGEVGCPDDNRDRRPPAAVAEHHEAGRESFERDRGLGGTRERSHRVAPKLHDRFSRHRHQRRLAGAHGGRTPVAHQQGRQPLGELGQLDRGTGSLAGGNELDAPGHLPVRSKREDRRCVVEIADRQAAGPSGLHADHARAARRHQQERSHRRAQQPKGG